MSSKTKKLCPPKSPPPQASMPVQYAKPRCSVQTAGPRGALAIFLFLTLAVIVTAWFAASVDQDVSNRLGVWTPLLSTAQARKAIRVKQQQTSNGRYKYRLEHDIGYISKAIKQKANRGYVLTHIKRFNQALKDRSYFFRKNGVINAQRDNIFQLQLGATAKVNPLIRVKNLSPYSRAPATAKEYKMLGNIYLKPPAHKIFSLIGSHLNLFLEPDNTIQHSVRTDAYGKQVRAGQIMLLDSDNQPLALLGVNNDQQTIFVQTQNNADLYLENNAAIAQADIQDGQMIEIGGLFMEARIEKALPLVETARTGKRPRRRYPLGNLVHIVGPAALDSSFQSLGIEYMFQEYLMGFEPANVKPGKIWLTIDLRLQTELTRQLSELASKSKVGRVSALIMNAGTGALMAMSAEPAGYNPADTAKVVGLLKAGRAHTQNHGCFKRHPIGSVTKPFFAFLGLNLIPELNTMRVNGPRTSEDRNARWKIFGHDMYSAKAIHKKKESHFDIPKGGISFESYLVQSKNIYQHSLGMLLLTGCTDLEEIPSPWRVVTHPKDNPQKKSVIIRPQITKKFMTYKTLGQNHTRNSLHINGNNPFAQKLKAVFGVETAAKRNVANDRDISVYGDASDKVIDLLDVAAEVLRMRFPAIEFPELVFKRRSAVCAPETARMDLNSVSDTRSASNILFGGNGNRWTDVKLCEAFSRMITVRNVQARIIHSFLNTTGKRNLPEEIMLESEAPPLNLQALNLRTETFVQMRTILQKVVTQGTAAKLKTVLTKIRRKEPDFMLLGKTGTINEDRMKSNSKLFIGCFGRWDAHRNEFTGTPYTFIIYLKAAKNRDAVLDFISQSLPCWWDILNPQKRADKEIYEN